MVSSSTYNTVLKIRLSVFDADCLLLSIEVSGSFFPLSSLSRELHASEGDIETAKHPTVLTIRSPPCEGQEGGGREWEGRGGREGKEEGKKRKGKEGGKTGWRGKDVVSLAMTQSYKGSVPHTDRLASDH